MAPLKLLGHATRPAPTPVTTIHGIEVSWSRVRDLFALDYRVAQLNHGSYGAVPIPVQRVQQRVREEMEANPMAFFSRGLVERLAHSRSHLATYLGAQPQCTAFVANATAASQVVLESLRFGAGDEIVLTDHGYGAVRLAADRLCARTGAVIREVKIPLPAADEDVISWLLAAVRPGRTRLVIVDHVTSPTAVVLPVAQIAAALRQVDIPLLVDAAHSPGMLAVDVASIGADFWLGNLHKWAFAPRGTALLVVSPAYRAAIEPLVVSWQQAAGFPASVEFGGTLDYTPWLAAPAGLHVLRTLGADQVRQHNASLAGYGQRVVGAALGLDLDGLPDPGPAPVSMRLLPLPAGVATERDSALALRTRLATEHRIEVALDSWNGRGYLRLSAQVYNRPEEYDRLAKVLPAALKGV